MPASEIPWNVQAAWPPLAVLQLLPLVGAGLMLFLRRETLALLAGIGLTGVQLLLAILLYLHHDPAQPALQFAERGTLVGWMNYHAAVDGVSILFILLTAFLSLLVAIYGPVRGLGPPWRLMALILAIEASLMVMFTTLNLLWFILALALQIGLVGAVLRSWATSPLMGPALKTFYKFMGTALALLLAGTLIIGWGQTHAQGGGWTFDLVELRRLGVEPAFQTLAFYLLFYGLAIRTPLFPLHGWLPPLAEHGNIALAPTFLLGLKVGIYGLLRFVLPLVPEAVQEWQSFVVGFAVVGIFYAALLAMVQEDLRRLLAFAVVSHTSLIVLGVFTLDRLALEGSVMLSVTFGLALAALLFMTGLVFQRTGTTQLGELGGLFDPLPFVGIAFLVAGLSIIGMPGTPGFDAAHLVMEASIDRFGGLLTIAAALGNVLAAGFLLWAFQRAFLGAGPTANPALASVVPTAARFGSPEPLTPAVSPPRRPEQGHASASSSPHAPVTSPPLASVSSPGPSPAGRDGIEPLRPAEWLVALAVIGVLLGVGFHSRPWLELIAAPLTALSAPFAQPQP